MLDNICHFMPQGLHFAPLVDVLTDRVAEFATLADKPEKLIEEVEKAMGEPMYFELHDRLKALGADKQRLAQVRDGCQIRNPEDNGQRRGKTKSTGARCGRD
jgi:hypothetical protein